MKLHCLTNEALLLFKCPMIWDDLGTHRVECVIVSGLKE